MCVFKREFENCSWKIVTSHTILCFLLSSSTDGDAVLLYSSWPAFLDSTHAFDRRIIQSMEFMLAGNLQLETSLIFHHVTCLTCLTCLASLTLSNKIFWYYAASICLRRVNLRSHGHIHWPSLRPFPHCAFWCCHHSHGTFFSPVYFGLDMSMWYQNLLLNILKSHLMV